MHDYAGSMPAAIVSGEREQTQDFEARLAESGTLAFRVAFSVLRQREDAEDVAQEAFVRAHRQFPSLRNRDRFRAWLVRVTWRLALDRRRADLRRTTREAVVDPGPTADVESDALERERSARLWAAIDRLPEKLRLPLVLASMEGHSLGDVSRMLAVREGTIKSRLFEARRRLKDWLS